MITDRIQKRREEKSALETQLAIERKKQVILSGKQVKAFLSSSARVIIRASPTDGA